MLQFYLLIFTFKEELKTVYYIICSLFKAVRIAIQYYCNMVQPLIPYTVVIVNDSDLQLTRLHINNTN